MNFMRCLPLLFFLHILPLNISFSIPSVLLMLAEKFQLSFSDGVDEGSFIASHVHYFGNRFYFCP